MHSIAAIITQVVPKNNDTSNNLRKQQPGVLWNNLVYDGGNGKVKKSKYRISRSGMCLLQYGIGVTYTSSCLETIICFPLFSIYIYIYIYIWVCLKIVYP